MPTLISNRKARHDYELLETLKAGVELFGYEVKSLRDGRGSLDGAHVIIRGGEAFLVGAHIPAFQSANAPKNYDPMRTRKLLLTSKEITRLAVSERGLTIVPISLYTMGRFIKVECAIAKGKKKHDKRETLKKRDDTREMERAMRARE